VPKTAPAPKPGINRGTQIIIWAAMLASIVMYYVVIRVARPAAPFNDVTIALVLAVCSVALVGLSFVVKRRMAERSGFITALAMCDAGAVLGVVSWFITASPLSLYPLLIAFGGIGLHFPLPPEPPE
jgi:hypothetical protein